MIPLSLGGSLPDLEDHTKYEVIACVPELGLASSAGSLNVVENPTVRTIRVLTYPFTGVGMDALAFGQLVWLGVVSRSPTRPRIRIRPTFSGRTDTH